MKKIANYFLLLLVSISLLICPNTNLQAENKANAGYRVIRPISTKTKVANTAPSPNIKKRVNIKSGPSSNIQVPSFASGVKLDKNSAAKKESTQESGILKGKPLYDASQAVPFKFGSSDSSSKEQK